MISFADAPFVVTLRDGNTAGDGGEILLLGVDHQKGLILAARELMWYDLSEILVETNLLAYTRDEGAAKGRMEEDAGSSG